MGRPETATEWQTQLPNWPQPPLEKRKLGQCRLDVYIYLFIYFIAIYLAAERNKGVPQNTSLSVV